MTSKRQVEYSFFGLLLFFILPFGFFEGQLLSEDNRKMGTYLIINAAFAIIAFAHLPFRIQFHIPGIRLLMILMAWLFVIHLFRDNYNQSLNNFSNILFTQVLVLLMVNFAWRIHFHRLLDILLLYFAFLLALCIWIHYTKVGLIEFGSHTPKGRLGGLFFFGITAVIAGLGLTISCFQIFFNKNSARIKYIAFSLFFLFCLVATDLRTSFFAFLTAGIYQYYCFLKMTKRKLFPLMLVAAVALIIFEGYKVVNQSGNEISNDLSFREKIWDISLIGIYQNPVWGYGSFSEFFSSNQSMTTNFYEQLNDPHSSYLSLVLQSGVISLILLILIIIAVCKRLFKLANHKINAVFSILIFWAIVGSTGGTFFNLYYNIGSLLFEISLFSLCFHPQFSLLNTKNAYINH